MDGFLQTPPGQSREAHSSKMAPVSPASSCSEPEQPTLADIGAEIRRLAANMVTKSDLQSLTTTLTASLTSAVTALRTDMEAQDGRIQALETQAQATQRQASAADTALTRQGNMLLALRRQVEDLDNRSRRSNIRQSRTGYWNHLTGNPDPRDNLGIRGEAPERTEHLIYPHTRPTQKNSRTPPDTYISSTTILRPKHTS
ncbi:Hypothetical predicted protein [Pelobates cultripes]|uniref:Uncharacterized protein n=1 Tax=Pelobates cultripes TaxID=61616 RepID=A0AAD1W327_PELCU|nr:Hypothetical predicted protein [Pelobates cultripes]